MDPGQLHPQQWYWVRKPDGTIVPHRLNRVLASRSGDGHGAPVQVEMFVGSMVQTFCVSQVIAPAEMPKMSHD